MTTPRKMVTRVQVLLFTFSSVGFICTKYINYDANILRFYLHAGKLKPLIGVHTYKGVIGE